MSVKSILRSFLLLGVLSQIVKSQYHIELVQVLFRHGERTPRIVEMYPKDPYNVSVYDPMGLGQLTNQGKATEYRIGKMLRNRYSDFLDKVYRPADVCAISTDVDRTKMSLLLVLAGLYPPEPSQIWDKDLPWMPIAIQYLPEKIDVVMKPHLCPVYEQAVAKVRTSKEVLDKLSKYRCFFEFLSEEIGLDVQDSNQVYELYNLLTAQKSMNLTSPNWCTDDVYKKIEEVSVLEYDIRSYTTQLKRISGGMLIKKFIANMNINGTTPNPRKLYLYSGHEVNLAAFTRALNLSEPKIPKYGSAILFEKVRNGTKYFVRILLWEGNKEEPVPYKLPGCDEMCPYEKYLSIVRDLLPSEEEESCLWNSITKEEIRKLYDDKIKLD